MSHTRYSQSPMIVVVLSRQLSHSTPRTVVSVSTRPRVTHYRWRRQEDGGTEGNDHGVTNKCPLYVFTWRVVKNLFPVGIGGLPRKRFSLLSGHERVESSKDRQVPVHFLKDRERSQRLRLSKFLGGKFKVRTVNELLYTPRTRPLAGVPVVG